MTLQKLYSWYGKRTVLGVLAAIIILIVVALGMQLLTTQDEPETVQNAPQVRTERVSNLSSQSAISVLGTASAISEARIQSEAAGRVTGVMISIDDYVSAGTVIATLENASQRAAVTQAEGVYETALASAAQSDVSVEEARNSLVSAQSNVVATIRSAYATAENTVTNSFDQFYANPRSMTPGVRLLNTGSAAYFNNERVRLASKLVEWQQSADTISTNSDLDAEITKAERDIEQLRSITDSFIIAFNDDETGGYTSAELASFSSEFATLKANLNNTLSNLETNATSLKNARDTLSRAQLGGTGGELSSAGGQVKQALGSLQAAQAALAKTIIRTPIEGEVNEVSVNTGDFINAFSPVAVVANNNALEITAFVSETERSLVSPGARAVIDDRFEGIVSRVAPAVDSETKKIEVIIQTTEDSITNGSTVRVRIDTSEPILEDQQITIPITALKVETDRIVVFTVDSSNKLVAHEIVEGPLVGNRIIIESGVTSDMDIVLDARGRNEGDLVSVVNN